jgi:hypothetical protein
MLLAIQTWTNFSPMALTFLESLAGQEALTSQVSDLISLYQKKLWHALTIKIEECFAAPAWNSGDLPHRFYQAV